MSADREALVKIGKILDAHIFEGDDEIITLLRISAVMSETGKWE